MPQSAPWILHFLPWGFPDNPPLEEELFLTIQEGSSEGWLWEMGETKMDQKQEHDVINSQPISTVALALWWDQPPIFGIISTIVCSFIREGLRSPSHRINPLSEYPPEPCRTRIFKKVCRIHIHHHPHPPTVNWRNILSSRRRHFFYQRCWVAPLIYPDHYNLPLSQVFGYC